LVCWISTEEDASYPSSELISLNEKWKKLTWKDDEEKQRLLDYPWTWVDESKDEDDIFMPRSKGKSIASSNDKSAAFSKDKSVAPPSIDSDDDFMPSKKAILLHRRRARGRACSVRIVCYMLYLNCSY
jgi:hypothetical protein